MRAIHIGLVCSNEQNADLFYEDLLGLEKQELKTIPVSIVKPLFGFDFPLSVVNYIGTGLHIEVFLTDRPGNSPDNMSHICLEVENADTLLDRAASLGFTVTRVSKGNDAWVLFLDDSDGNRYEVKKTVAGL